MDYEILENEPSDISDGEFNEEDFESDPFKKEEDDEEDEEDEEIDGKKNKDIEIDIDNDIDIDVESESEDITQEELVNEKNKNIKSDVYKKIEEYKKMNMENGSKYLIISLMSNLSIFIKNGGSMLDGREIFDYPNETEESYIIESLLLNTQPMENIVNNYLINLNHESIIINLKQALTCVLKFDKIFFTPDLRKNFPIFIKNIFNYSVSEEEWEEINKVKKMRNING